MTVRTRFAPSPTGKLHLGSIRTALYNWLYARHCGGEFILRIEDTDRERSTTESTQLILDSLDWLGLDYDQGPFYQSQRLEVYHAWAEKLIAQGLAYRCSCSKEKLDQLREGQLTERQKPRYDGHCRDKNLPQSHEGSQVIRFKNPLSGVVNFVDRVLGNLSFQNSELDDLILIKSDGFPTYNFCVVIDDLEMEISHVIRGADHINNTPRQINLFRALKAEPPTYAHIPLILGGDGKLLSKRHGAASALEYRDQGFLKEALINYLSRLGWSHGNQEIFSIEELISLFDINDVNKAAAAFDQEKLLWLNRHYIKSSEPSLLTSELRSHIMSVLQVEQLAAQPRLEEVVKVLRERSDTLVDMAHKAADFYRDAITYSVEAKSHLTEENMPYIAAFFNGIAQLGDQWTPEHLHQLLVEVAAHFGVKLGKIAQPIRVAVTGGTVSPPLNHTVYLLGRDRTIARLQQVLDGEVSSSN